MVTSYGSISAGWVDLWHLSLESDKIIDVLGRRSMAFPCRGHQ
jgi:hypothetical protein